MSTLSKLSKLMFSSKSWSPFAVGIGIGALSIFSFVTAKKPLGVTTPFEGTAAAMAQKVAPGVTKVNRYLAQSEQPPRLDWEWMLAASIVAGSALSAAASNERSRGTVPALWARRYGPSPLKRSAAAFAGGALMMFGARMAKGCTSGHGISGVLQLAASSWLFVPVMGASAALTARLLFGNGKGGRGHAR